MDDLSDRAFRVMVKLWCWCGEQRTDGFVREVKWREFVTPAVQAQLLRVPPGFKYGLAERVDGGYLMHDFTGPGGHQRSRDEIETLAERRAEAGRKGGRTRSKPQASA
jgi:hypothetical protein